MIFTPENAPYGEQAKKTCGYPDLYTDWLQAWENVDPFEVKKDIEDTMVCILEYRNGVKATFHTNACSPFQRRRMCLYGLTGAVEADLCEGSLRVARLGETPWAEPARRTDGHGGGDINIMKDLYKSMVTGCTPKATGLEGLKSAIVCLALDEARISGAVVDLEPYWAEFSL